MTGRKLILTHRRGDDRIEVREKEVVELTSYGYYPIKVEGDGLDTQEVKRQLDSIVGGSYMAIGGKRPQRIEIYY